MRKAIWSAVLFMGLSAFAGPLVIHATEETEYDMYDQASYLTFDANGGEGQMEVKRVKEPSWVKLPKCLFTRPGYVFGGWCAGCEDCEEGGSCWRRPRQKVWVMKDQTFRAVWKKLWVRSATNYCAYVTDASDAVRALVFVKVGRPGASSGTTAVSATVVQPGAKNFTLRGRTDTGVVDLEGRVAKLHLEMTESSLNGTLDGYPVVGAPIPDMTSGTRFFEATDPAASTGPTWTYLPAEVPVTVARNAWTAPKSGVLKLVDGALEPCSAPVNPWKLSVRYHASTGRFSGSFQAYTGVDGKVNIAVADACKVAGVVVDGVGWGYALGKSGTLFQVRVR